MRFAGRTPILPRRVNEEVLAEVRAIGATTASAPGIHERDTVAARVDALLADPDDPEARGEFIRWAERTAVRAPTAEMRSAARLLLTLLRDGAPPAALHTVDPPLTISINPRAALVAQDALALCRELGFVEGAGYAAYNWAHAAFCSGLRDEALAPLREAVEDAVTLHLAYKHTDCLAKEACCPPIRPAKDAVECCGTGCNC